MKELSLGKISIHIYGEDIAVKDLFINDESFQHYLRSSFKNEFSNGRFKEPFMLRLEPELSSLIENKKSSSNHLLYGCADGCCDYIFVKIKLDNNKIIWDKIGRNTDYVHPKPTIKNKIQWLTNFKPIIFSKENYNQVMNQIESK
jgi:hypothetical protein